MFVQVGNNTFQLSLKDRVCFFFKVENIMIMVGVICPPAHLPILTHSLHFFALLCVPRGYPLGTASPHSFALCLLVGFGQYRSLEGKKRAKQGLMCFFSSSSLTQPTTTILYGFFLTLDLSGLQLVPSSICAFDTGRLRASHCSKALIALTSQPCLHLLLNSFLPISACPLNELGVLLTPDRSDPSE